MDQMVAACLILFLHNTLPVEQNIGIGNDHRRAAGPKTDAFHHAARVPFAGRLLGVRPHND